MPATMATLPAGCDGTCSWARKQTWHLGALACAKGEVNVRSGAGVGNYRSIPFPKRSVVLFVMTLSQGLCWWDGCQGCREVVSLGAPEESKVPELSPKWPVTTTQVARMTEVHLSHLCAPSSSTGLYINRHSMCLLTE